MYLNRKKGIRLYFIFRVNRPLDQTLVLHEPKSGPVLARFPHVTTLTGRLHYISFKLCAYWSLVAVWATLTDGLKLWSKLSLLPHRTCLSLITLLPGITVICSTKKKKWSANGHTAQESRHLAHSTNNLLKGLKLDWIKAQLGKPNPI